MNFRLLLVGLGNLGFRYLEGIIKIENIEIYVLDSDEGAYLGVMNKLKLSHKNLSLNRIKNLDNIDNVPFKFDLIIFATTAGGRVKLIQDILNRTSTKFIIIEKVIAQSNAELDDLKLFLQKKSIIAWINTPRRLMDSWINVKKSLQNKFPIDFKLEGKKWGLASNSIHFLDLLEWLTETKIQKIKLIDKNGPLYETKRSGYFDITGKIQGYYQDGSKFQLISNNSSNEVVIDIVDNIKHRIQINETKNFILYDISSSQPFEIIKQSELIVEILSKIILSSNSDLPEFNSSYTNHNHLFKTLSSNIYLNKYDRLPIT